MNIFDQAQDLLFTLKQPFVRGSGRTTSDRKLAKKIKAKFIVPHVLNSREKNDVSLNSLDKLRGSRDPIIVDHYTWEILMAEMIREYKTVVSQLSITSQKIQEIEKILRK